MPSATSQPDRTAAWAAWVQDLASGIAGLADEGVLTVTGPASTARPSKPRVGLVKRILGQTYETAPPWISLARQDELVRATCVHDDRALGFPLSPEEKSSLARLGWRPGGPTDGPGLQRWFPDDLPSGPYLPAADASAAAAVVATTLREVFGVLDPADLSRS